MKIEVGKTYITRDSSLSVTITKKTHHLGTYRFVGRDNLDRVTWRSAKGMFDLKPSRLDLVAEVIDQ